MRKQEKVDVAIIGSGIGGLCAGAVLAHGGFKVLVVEKLPRIGGRYSTIDYNGYKICTGGIAVELGGPIEQVFREVRAEFDVHIRPVDQVVWRVKGKDLSLPARGGLRYLINACADSDEEATRVLKAIGRGLRWQEPSSYTTCLEWMSKYTSNRSLLGLWHLMSTAELGPNAWDAPADAMFQYFKHGGFRYYAFMPEGPIVLAQSLANLIRSKGGDVWTRCRARQILVKDEEVKGTMVERDGEEINIAAQAVISNVGPRNTINLVGEDNIDRGYVREVREINRPVPWMWLHFACDRPLMEHTGSLLFTEARKMCVAIVPTNSCPENAPSGKHLLVAGGAPVTPASGLKLTWKRELEDLLQDVRDNFPGVDEHARLLHAATFESAWPAFGSWAGRMLSSKTPVELLYNVGDAVIRTGHFGAHGCADIGKAVAEDVKMRISPAAG